MGYKIFADTNVFLDHLLRRTTEWQYAKELFSLADERAIEVYTSSSSMVNVLYALKQQKLSKKEIVQLVTYLLSYTRLSDLPGEVFINALASGFSDLEDAVQYYSALHIQTLDYFITSNIKDYKNASSQLPVITSKQFINIYHKKNQSP